MFLQDPPAVSMGTVVVICHGHGLSLEERDDTSMGKKHGKSRERKGLEEVTETVTWRPNNT